MNIVSIIPVRLAATRFPNKPFAKIDGLPMFHYVYNRVLESCTNTLLAICDEKIETYCRNHNLQFISTNPNHQSGSDRVGEVISKIEMKENIHKVINVQGDMPFISKEHIKLLISKIDYFEMSTLGCPFIDKKEFRDLNKVKLLIKEDNKNVVAENFFREPMHASEMNVNTFHHIGLYGYQISFLKKFLQMPISEREKTEKLEQLRIQDLNKIGVSIIKENILGVDTKEDLIKVNNILKQ
ncbi:MAG: 3-deoxy-manno-octulosonate cytidylyltransferase [Alphaproteobacteria bacterium]|jgi:3-deoxy-manno-octulosonate cytidylyltransferase (CMP-KDO synthetase)|nr:3-deoxy-manno-octulosonate cytidylyltransferase [Alphaproteobacteria bacterium]